MQIRSLSCLFSFLIQFSCLCQCTWIHLQDRAKLWSLQINFIYSCKVSLKAPRKILNMSGLEIGKHLDQVDARKSTSVKASLKFQDGCLIQVRENSCCTTLEACDDSYKERKPPRQEGHYGWVTSEQGR